MAFSVLSGQNIYVALLESAEALEKEFNAHGRAASEAGGVGHEVRRRD